MVAEHGQEFTTCTRLILAHIVVADLIKTMPLTEDARAVVVENMSQLSARTAAVLCKLADIDDATVKAAVGRMMESADIDIRATISATQDVIQRAARN